jgi:predicted small lipoprotein YifL
LSLGTFAISRRRRLAALVAATAVGLCGCGRIGPLEPPAGATPPTTPMASTPDAVLNPQSKPKVPPITAPHVPFFLDPLLK